MFTDDAHNMQALKRRIAQARMAEQQLQQQIEMQREREQAEQQRFRELWEGFMPPQTVLLAADVTRLLCGLDLMFDGDPVQLDGKLEQTENSKGRIRVTVDGWQQTFWLPRGVIDRPLMTPPRQWSSNPKLLLDECARRSGADVPTRQKFWE